MKELNIAEIKTVSGGVEQCPAPWGNSRLTTSPGTIKTKGSNPFAPGSGGGIPYVKYQEI
ncbi:hypothetical protein [Stenotrophomonas sp. Iso1]|uniref:hypothetical protein n=1 Tax=Stenotrophomonas sp. Iso1 TaxID=2977283 RepID=UPI0022B7A49D|nr:hypothetical protein [Stenotrophomonas sp. Iso1]